MSTGGTTGAVVTGEYDAEIAKLEAILNVGASEVVVDGQKVKYDLNQVRKRLTHYKVKNGDIAKKPFRVVKL